MREVGITKGYVKVLQDMYEGCRTRERLIYGETESFEVTVGVHQESATNPFLFLIKSECLTKDVRREAPWDMLFANDVVICTKTREKAEVKDWKDDGVHWKDEV